MVYIVVFLISIFWGFLADKSKKYCQYFLLLSMLPPLILGGIRSEYVGTDNRAFFKPIFNNALSHDTFSSFLMSVDSNEYASYALFYYIPRLIKDYHAFCFVTTFISLLFVYIAIYRERKELRMWIALAIYYFLFYCPMLCYVRQSMAISICLFSMHYVHENKNMIFLLLVALASLFHTTALIFVSYIIVYRYLEGEKYFAFKVASIIVFSILIVSLYVKYFSILADKIDFLSGRMETLAYRYTSEDNGHEGSSIGHVVLMMLSVSPPIFISIMNRKVIGEKYAIMALFVGLACICEIITYTDSLTARLALYFFFPSILLLGKVSRKSVMSSFLSIGYVVMYWLVFVVLNKIGFTLPVYPYITDVF